MKRRFSVFSAVGAITILSVTTDNVAAQGTGDADPADVETIDAIVAAVYDVISGPAGPRDWDRFRSLFAPGAQLIPTGRRQNFVGANRNTVDEYVRGAGEYFMQQPFYEVEANRVTERYGNIAHAFSTYESRRSPDEEPFVRGINSFQLMNDGSRWWVVNIFWADENVSGPIPEKYMSGN